MDKGLLLIKRHIESQPNKYKESQHKCSKCGNNMFKNEYIQAGNFHFYMCEECGHKELY
jgi:DNA-directed RNA polymerase subunit RPC12/RpoP